MGTEKKAVSADKYKAYDERNKEKGVIKVHPRIPLRDKERVLKYCARLRKAYDKELAAESRA